LRDYRIPVSIRELLDCLRLMQHRLIVVDIGQFYVLSRMALVKDEKYYDRFDLAFDAFFCRLNDVSTLFDTAVQLPALNEFLMEYFPKSSEQERRDIFEEYQRHVLLPADDLCLGEEVDLKNKNRKLFDQDNSPGVITGQLANKEQLSVSSVAEALDESDEERHQHPDDSAGDGEEGVGEDGEKGEGDNGKEGTGEEGTSGEGKNGVVGIGEGSEAGNGIRAEFELEAQRSASKVWQLRQFEDYDSDVELGTRNLKMALRRLRKFARTGAQLELDMAETIRCTARNGGLLDIKEVPERHNNVKVLLFLDVGGSMDDHVELCKQLFVAAKSEFKHLETYYFHNFIYDQVWASSERRRDEQTPILDLVHKFGRDYKIIFVGDANMARDEIAEAGGSVEHFNKEPGQIWLRRIQDQFDKIIWLNPAEKRQWPDSYSTQMINRLLEEKMYHLSVDGIEQAMKFLVR
jgi:uncharacterized protein with von Willebrand factor type A (vWA) domain